MNEEIHVRIRNVLIDKIQSEIRPEDLKRDTPLIEFGVGVDSIATLELLVALESEFQITIDEDEVNQELLENIDCIAEYIIKRIEVST
ncbi:acyl carrier protein [Desulfobacterota bacterium AH_259_B03_O07]|nr:acyl carrier protein [Desulfobacterota bacterium AH_259_B03_O07]